MSDQLTERVLHVIANTQRISPEKVTMDKSFQELGIDSMDGINILFALENEFDVEFPDRMLRRGVFESVSSIKAALEELTSEIAA